MDSKRALSVDAYLNKLTTDLTSDEYHGFEGSYSSSQIKTMMDGPEKFRDKYITRTLPKDSGAHFDVGTYLHTATLEPEKLESECIVYRGGMRAGAKWKAFEEEHKGKVIITESEEIVANHMIKAINESELAQDLIRNSKPEVSAFIKIYVLGGEVFTIAEEVNGESGEVYQECYLLCSNGWMVDSQGYEIEDIEDLGFPMVIKVRADALDLERGKISDVKSSSSDVMDPNDMKKSTSNYSYDLSAALYLDVFTIAARRPMKEFNWIYAQKNKEFSKCRVWRASDRNIMIGRAKWRHSVIQIAKYSRADWQIAEEVHDLEPAQWDLDWLTKI